MIERSKGNHCQFFTCGFFFFFKLDLSFILQTNYQIFKDKIFLNKMPNYLVILAVLWMINYINLLRPFVYRKFNQTLF
jgi:hypothetical protein